MTDAESIAALQPTIDHYLAIINSERNQANYLKWDHALKWERDNWRARPLGRGLLVIDPDRPFFAQVLGFDLKAYYRSPAAHLRDWLHLNIFKFEHFNDDSYYAPVYRPWWGVVTEASLFGAEVLYREDRDLWIGSPPLLEEKGNLDRLRTPDFFSSGLMPMIHETCSYAERALSDRVEVVFPTWARGPLSTAMQLRGMDNLLMDMVDDPSFVHELMRFITDSRKAWLAARAQFLDQPIQRGLLFNDEVGAPIISPRHYRKFVLPYEIELADYQGGIYYWHSCGDTTAFLADIATIPGLKLFHCGPHTSVTEAARRFPTGVDLEVCLQDVRDVYQASDEQIRANLLRIRNETGDHRYYVRSDGYYVWTTPEADLASIRRLVEITAEGQPTAA